MSELRGWIELALIAWIVGGSFVALVRRARFHSSLHGMVSSCGYYFFMGILALGLGFADLLKNDLFGLSFLAGSALFLLSGAWEWRRSRRTAHTSDPT